ncbi:MAG: O-antigen ligase family protein [Caulobacteraceae bacterium]
MTSADEAPTSSRTSGVMRPYVGAERPVLRRRVRGVVVPAVVVFCLLLGLLFAFVAPYLVTPLGIPLIVLLLLSVWALPAARTAPTRTLEGLFFVFFVMMVLWPNYIAISLPGLPWITMVRLTGFPLVFTLLVCTSVSSQFRTETAETLKSVSLIWKLLVTFVAIQVVSIVFSKDIADSIQKLVVYETSWTAVFFASVYVFRKPRRVETWAALMWTMGIFVGLLGLWEERSGHVPWAFHMPSFLHIEQNMYAQIVEADAQLAATAIHRITGAYRIISVFGNSLTFAEYMAFTFPFVLNFIAGHYRWWVRLAAIVSLPFFLVVVLDTGSRLGAVGLILSCLFYLLAWAVMSWRRRKSSIFGPAIALAYPVIFVVAIASTFMFERLRAVVWGNGPEAASNQGRILEYTKGIPMVLTRPWGHGIGMGATTLGIYSADGKAAIDTYYLLIALEYGVVGFAIYFGMILLAIYVAGKTALSAPTDNRDYAFLVPIAIALVNFFVISSVFSQQDNNPLVFMMLGMIVALVWRIGEERKAARRIADAEFGPVKSPPRAVFRARP